MPEETPIESTETKTVEIEKSKVNKTLSFKKSKFITYTILAGMVALSGIIISYMVGYDSGSAANKPTVESSKEKTEKEEKEEGLIDAELGDEIKVKNGITIKLEEASIDQSYEKQKEEQKKYYNQATQSAYLESDYFKYSYLKVRVSLNNTNKVTLSYNPGDFRLKDSDDVQYVYSTGEEKTLYNLTPSETTKISLSYYVPSEEKNFKLIFDNAVVSFKLK